MRGTPYFQAILMFAVFLLAGVPVYRLTRPATPETAATTDIVTDPGASDPPAKPAPVEVEAVFAPAPADFQIRNLDQTVLAGRGPQARFTARWMTAVPAEGVDLVIQAHWPVSAADSTTGAAAGASPAAARVTVRFPSGRQAEKSVWASANGTANEVFTVPGDATPATP